MNRIPGAVELIGTDASKFVADVCGAWNGVESEANIAGNKRKVLDGTRLERAALEKEYASMGLRSAHVLDLFNGITGVGSREESVEFARAAAVLAATILVSPEYPKTRHFSDESFAQTWDLHLCKDFVEAVLRLIQDLLQVLKGRIDSCDKYLGRMATLVGQLPFERPVPAPAPAPQ